MFLIIYADSKDSQILLWAILSFVIWLVANVIIAFETDQRYHATYKKDLKIKPLIICGFHVGEYKTDVLPWSDPRKWRDEIIAFIFGPIQRI